MKKKFLRKRRWRQVWLKTHLYLALGVGLLFAVVGLTGSVNVFYVEIDELLNPGLVVTDPQGSHRPLDEILEAVRAAHPNRKDSWQLVMPRHASGMLTAWYYKPKETEHMFFGPLMVSVNPYTAEVVASRFWGGTVATWIYELHADLWLGKFGYQIVGILGIAMIGSLSTGLYLWWPSRRRLKQALTIKWETGFHRRIFDFHRTSGIYSLLVLFVLAGTGIYLVYKDYVSSLTHLFSTVREKQFEDKKLKSSPIPELRPISITQAVGVSDRIFAEATLKSVTTPGGPEGVYRIDKRQPGEANEINPASRVWVDQYSGQVLAVRDPNKFTAGETFLNVLWPLHSGEALRMPGRIIVCLAGLFPSLLYVTGITLWWRKRRNRLRRGAILFTEGVRHA